MKYGLRLVPAGSVPRDTALKLKLQPLPPPGAVGPGGCHPAFAGFAVTGDATYNAAQSIAVQTWNFPCTGSPWSIVVQGFAIGCGGTFTWGHPIDNGTTLAAHVTFTPDVDPIFGGPILRIDGDGADMCVDSSATITINLILNGDTNFSTSIQLRPTPPAMQLQFDAGTFIGGTDEWTYFSTGDGVNNGGLSVSMPPGGADAQYQFTFEVLNSTSDTWSVDTSGSDPGFTIVWFSPGPNQITFDITRSGGANGLAINFYATDDLTGNVDPVGAPTTQFQIVG